MKGTLMSIEYTRETRKNYFGKDEEIPVVYLWVRGEDGKRYQLCDPTFKPYFYALSGVPLTFRDAIHMETRDEPTIGKVFKKIYVRMPDDVRKLRMIAEAKGYADFLYEADILFVYRYLIDKKIRSTIEWRSSTDFNPLDQKLEITPRIVFLDTEIYAKRSRDPGKIRDNEWICCVTLHDNYTNQYFTYYVKDSPCLLADVENNWTLYWCTSEEDLLHHVLEKIKELNPDIISGFNIDYDLMHLRYQCIRHRVLSYMEDISPLKYIPKPRSQKKKLRDILLSTPRLKVPGRSVCDLLETLLAIHKAQLVEYNLEYISRKFLSPPNNCKITMTDGSPIAEHMVEAWDSDPALVLRYNKRDVELCVRLNKERRLFAFMDQLRKLVGAKVEDALSAKKLIDLELLRRSRYPLPNGRKRRGTYKGAVVVAPTLTKYGWIIQLDYKQLYPTIMLTYNIDPDTWLHPELIKGMNPDKYYSLTDPETGEVFYFKREPLGTMPQMIKDFLVARDEKRKLMKEAKERKDDKAYELYDAESFALKSFINAIYGVLSYRFRKASEYCGKVITLCGRELTKLAIKIAQDNGYKVVYGDTDSIFVEAKSQGYSNCIREGLALKRLVELVIPDLLKLNSFTGQSLFTIEVDKVYSAFFTLDVKKRYAGYIEPDHKLYVAGLESKRSDSSKFARGLQEKVMRMLLDGATKNDLLAYVNNTLNSYDSVDSLEIAVPSALTKDIDKYLRLDKKTGRKVPFNPTQKKAALNSNEYLGTKYRAGDKPKRVYVTPIEEKIPKNLEEKKLIIMKTLDVIAIEKSDQIPEWLEIDYSKMLEKTVKNKIEKMLLVQPYNIDWNNLGLKEELKIVKKPRKKVLPKSQTTMTQFSGGS